MAKNTFKIITSVFLGACCFIIVDVLIRFSVEHFGWIVVKPRYYWSSGEDVLSDFLSSLSFIGGILGWYYLLFYSLCYYLTNRLSNKPLGTKIGMLAVLYLIFWSLNEDILLELRSDILLVTLLMMAPMGSVLFLLTKYIRPKIS